MLCSLLRRFLPHTKSINVRFILISIITFCLFALPTHAQFWEIGGGAGVTTYHGDLAPDFSMQPPGAAASIYVRRNLDQRIALRLGFSFGTMSANDSRSLNAYRKARNLSFQSDLYEGSFALEFNFLPYHHKKGAKGAGAFTPYLVAGFGVFRFNPKAWYKGGLYELQPLGTEGQAPGNEYSLIQGNLLIGGGFKIDISRYLALSIEGSTRILFTDYLDDVGGTYANSRVIEGHRGSLANVAIGLSDRSGEIGQQMGSEGRQRGNPKNNDGYTMFQIGIHYTIWTISCPTY